MNRSRSIPRENAENLRRRIRDFGQSNVATSRDSGGVLDLTNRHSIEVTSTERSNDFTAREEDNDALSMTAANIAFRRRRNCRPTEANEARSSPTELQDEEGQSSTDL